MGRRVYQITPQLLNVVDNHNHNNIVLMDGRGGWWEELVVLEGRSYLEDRSVLHLSNALALFAKEKTIHHTDMVGVLIVGTFEVASGSHTLTRHQAREELQFDVGVEQRQSTLRVLNQLGHLIHNPAWMNGRLGRAEPERVVQVLGFKAHVLFGLGRRNEEAPGQYLYCLGIHVLEDGRQGEVEAGTGEGGSNEGGGRGRGRGSLGREGVGVLRG